MKLGYRPDLDGLRAVAVLSVLLFHLKVPYVTGGFVGVDVFFVLSGFLITRILAANAQGGRPALLDFYDRRIRRIFPALIVVLAFCAVVAIYLLLPDELSDFGASLGATTLSFSNFFFYAQSGYFAPNADLQPLLHTWSLSIEEQFYFIFPLLLFWTATLDKDRQRLIIWGILAASLVISILRTEDHPEASFFLLPSRAWELLIGSVLALRFVPAPGRHWHREVAAALGIVLIAVGVFTYTKQTVFPGYAALAPCIGAALFIWAGDLNPETGTLTSKLLGTPVLVFIGLISYSLYLWHWPLIVFAKLLSTEGLTATHKVAIAALSIALSALTWRLVEQPLRRGGLPWPTRTIRFTTASVLATLMVAVGTGMWAYDGLPHRFPDSVLSIAQATNDKSPFRRKCHFDGSDRGSFARTCVLGAPVEPSVIVLSDSHGVEIAAALGELAKERGESVRQISASSCPPALGLHIPARPTCQEYLRKIVDQLVQLTPRTIIIAAFFASWLEDPDIDKFWVGIGKTVGTFKKAGHRVILVGAAPRHPNFINVARALATYVRMGRDPETYRYPAPRAKEAHIKLTEFANSHGVEFISYYRLLCDGQPVCRGMLNGTVMYFDRHHLSFAGAKIVARELIAPRIWQEISDRK